ncbi:hypothetical protein DMENIID0001_020700 [Sergentomyia squamirostris]
MWTHRKVFLISLVLILSLVSICLRKQKVQEPQQVQKVHSSKSLENKLWLDIKTEANRTNLLYVFSLRRAPFWDWDFHDVNSNYPPKPEETVHKIDKIGNNDRNGDGMKVKSSEVGNNVNSAEALIISCCIVWLLLSLGKACFEVKNDLKERKKSSRNASNADVTRRSSLQQFGFAKFDRKSVAAPKLCRRSTIESFQPATSFATNYELMRANEAQRNLTLNPASYTPPPLTRRSSVPAAIFARQLPRQSSLGTQSPFQRQPSGESSGGVDRSPEGKRRMRMLYRH